MEERTRKPNRSVDEKLTEIDEKIEYHKRIIAQLKDKRKKLLSPKITYREILANAKEQGYTPEQIAKKLHIKL